MSRKLLTLTIFIIAMVSLIGPASASDATIQIKTEPFARLAIYLDGEHIGSTFNVIEGIAPGTYELTIRDKKANRYVPITKTITIEEGMDYFEIVDVQRQGLLTINSYPSEAEIYIDGELLETGYTNVSVDLPAGVHNIEVNKDGYYSANQTVNMSENFPGSMIVKEIELTLEKMPEDIEQSTPATETTTDEITTDANASKQTPGFTALVAIALIGITSILTRKREH